MNYPSNGQFWFFAVAVIVGLLLWSMYSAKEGQRKDMRELQELRAKSYSIGGH